MRILTRYILKEHLLPFLYALLILIFLLFTNFLLRAVDKFLGKGLPLGIIIEYLSLNTAWILALAAPMAVLVATLMSFGRMSQDNEIVALKGSGVSFMKMLGPALAFSMTIAGILIYFNNAVLPHMNHQAKLLSRDIYRKRPDLNVEAGYFIDYLPQYSFIVKGKRGTRYQDVRIFGKERVTTQTSIHAEEGTFTTIGDAILITLYNGEIHELDVKNYQNYRRISFEKHRINISADNLSLQRRATASRSDREMTIDMMKEKIASYEKKIADVKGQIRSHLTKEIPNAIPPEDFDQVSDLIDQYRKTFESDPPTIDEGVNKKKRALNMLKQRLKAEYQLLGGYQRSVNRYAVEIHKKFSIPLACIVFVLIGAPLGVVARKGFFKWIFLFFCFLTYWAFLIAGEELADRNLLSPLIAMWTPNLIFCVIGIFLSFQTSREQKFIHFTLFDKLKKSKDQT